MKTIPGRMERINLGQDFSAMVDFAHTPNALMRALETARQMTQGRVIAVFGSAGLRDREKRRLMAEVSQKFADISILTAEDPRTESLSAILADMASAAESAGGKEGETFYRMPDRRDAIRQAVNMARPGDLVICCGKGHEQSMCFGTTEYPWDDRTALRAALSEKLGIEGPSMPITADCGMNFSITTVPVCLSSVNAVPVLDCRREMASMGLHRSQPVVLPVGWTADCSR